MQSGEAMQELHDAIAAVCPIEGVAVVDPVDSSTWRIDFAPEATEEEKAAAQNVIDTWVPTGEPVKRAVKEPIKKPTKKRGRKPK
jgi:hypothetical protein